MRGCRVGDGIRDGKGENRPAWALVPVLGLPDHAGNSLQHSAAVPAALPDLPHRLRGPHRPARAAHPSRSRPGPRNPLDTPLISTQQHPCKLYKPGRKLQRAVQHLASRSLNPCASTGHRWSGLSAPPARCSASRHCSSSTPAGFTRAAGLSTTFSSRCWKRYRWLEGPAM